MVRLYHDEDADMSVLKGKTVAVIGYGSQGMAQAQMMRDSGIKVILGLRQDGNSWKRAKQDGFEVYSIEDAAKKADVIHVLIPDQLQPSVYKESIEKYLKPGKVLSFSHGFSITFKKITPPTGVDVIMVAPKAPGPMERRIFLEGFGVPALIAIEKNASGKAKNTALAMAKAMHFTKAGVLECTFYDEATEDLFGEQAVLCGGLVELIKAGFNTLVEGGYPPELAYFECLHEVKLIVDLIYEGGIEHMWSKVSNTAEYGGRTRGKMLINAETKKTMKKMLEDIQKGKFADEWMAEAQSGMPKLKKMRQDESKETIEKVGSEIRKLFQKK
jgi:ketol-acid reductoisomerase